MGWDISNVMVKLCLRNFNAFIYFFFKLAPHNSFAVFKKDFF